MSKNINVPKLRFKEFTEDWEDKLFGEIATNKSKKYNPQKDKNSYKCIELEHLSSENGSLLGYIDSLSSESIKNMFNKNNVLFGKLRPYLKKYLLASFDGVCSSEIWVLNGIEVNNSFLYYIVQGEYFINLANQSSGSKMPRADWDNIANSIFFIPQKQEQEKIALFLSSVDTKIEQLTKKDELLQQYKKGVMQKIFNQEIRFKADDGIEFPEWEEKRLSDIGEIITGKTPSTTNNNLWNGNIEFITPTDIYDKTKYQPKTLRTVKQQNNMKVLPIGSIVYTCIASIGKMSLTTLFSITNQQINSIIVNSLYNNEYIYYSLKYLTPYIQSTQANTTLPIINKTEFSKFKINIPCLEEQNKIASFLSSIDNKIEENQKILEKTKEFKKSLLQQMFV